jgi:hypothetical protein
MTGGTEGFVRSYVVFALLFGIKLVSRLFYRHDLQWMGEAPPHPWRNVRLGVLLNHTSLYEPLFAGGLPNHFLWRIARHGVIPAADKTIDRPLVGLLFKFVAHQVVSITRQRDHTWFAVLHKIDPDSMVIIAPEGRMKRRGGLDSQGNPMTVRGGVADILDAVQEGKMVLGYSGGLHHIQAPGELLPRPFKTIRMRMEELDIAGYRHQILARGGPDNFRRNVIADLERRRDLHCPVQSET